MLFLLPNQWWRAIRAEEGLFKLREQLTRLEEKKENNFDRNE